MNDKDISEAIAKLLDFDKNNELTKMISKIEHDLQNQKSQVVNTYLERNDLDKTTLQSALIVKKRLGQINVLIHALGIVNLLPYILEDNEIIEELSIGAGNTNRPFDLVTNKRVAEFKFVNWSGSQDTIRQNNIFKDFFELAIFDTDKKKNLYVFDKNIVLKFFNNNRALNSVLSKNISLRNEFFNLYGNKYSTVSEYYRDNHTKVDIVEMRDINSDLFYAM